MREARNTRCEVICVKCGDVLVRSWNIKNAVCFDCTTKRKNEYNAKRKAEGYKQRYKPVVHS